MVYLHTMIYTSFSTNFPCFEADKQCLSALIRAAFFDLFQYTRRIINRGMRAPFAQPNAIKDYYETRCFSD
ncbi:hypothetical protein VPAL9027_02061 [Vibrio palustris]|uniref:Uncharacterized protein n=1 Tax=Vibrio palustris TaxID=1918946 RepID=A0A1R4B594_9VIBR|nr:hypothetical protein VPAL9027_02061 [Vibrio palustris]